MKFDLNTQFINAYRLLSVSVLTLIFSVAVTYAFLVVFYAISSSWATPITLSPTQQRVLTFQPQVAQLEANFENLKYEIALKESSIFIKNEQLRQATEIIDVLERSAKIEVRQAQALSGALSRIVGDKRIDIRNTDKVIKDAQQLIATIDQELAAGLITKDDAAQRRLSAQQALNAATDAKLRVAEVDAQVQQLRAGAATLSGGAASLAAAAQVRQIAELRVQIAALQLEVDALHKEVSVKKVNLSEVERILNTARDSPYYQALRQKVTVLFVPYENMASAKPGEYVYDCLLQVLLCHKVGVIDRVWEAEEYARHPLFKSDLKGKFVSVKFFDLEATESQVVFIGGRPLFI